MGFLGEFKDFLTEYKVIGLAIAFVMGAAISALVTSLVNNLIMPVIGLVLPGGDWQTAVIMLGTAKIGIGAFVGALINFIIIALVIFLMAKIVLKEEKVTKK
jgi:large conductance mechanosensitive channel